MDCTFNKFRNALGVYRVVIDSVLTTVQSNNKEFSLDLQIPKLIDYFKDFQYEASDTNEFVALALDSVVNAYDVALSTLNEANLIELNGLSSEQEMSLRNNFQGHLTKIYKIEIPKADPKLEQDSEEITPTTTLAVRENTIAKGDINPVVSRGMPETNNWASVPLTTVQNIDVPSSSINNFSDIESNYYKGGNTALIDLKKNLTEELFSIRILQPLISSSNNATKVVNKEIRNLKNRLFQQMTADLMFENPDGNMLYDSIGNMVQPRFNSILESVKNSFKAMNGGAGVSSENLIAWSKMPTDKRQMLHKYNAFVTLSNFDLLLEERSGGTIGVKQNLKGIETSADKYFLNTTNKMRTGYSDANNISALDETTKLYKMFLETIPLIKLNGNVSSGVYLNYKQVSHTLGKLQKELNLSDPTGSLMDTLTDVLKNIDNRGARNLDNNDLSTILTLYARVFRNKASDQVLKTANKNLGRILNNLDHSTEYKQFNSSESIYNLFSNVHTSGNDINFLDLVASNILKVDVKTYGEVTYNFTDNSYKQVVLSSKLTDKQKLVLRDGLGGQIASKTSNVINSLKKVYNLDINGKNVIFGLDGINITYNVQTGKFTNSEGNEITNFGNQETSSPETSDSTLGNWSGVNIPKYNIDTADILQLVDGVPNQYTNYNRIVQTFERMLNQPLSSDNYKLLDLFRSEIDSNTRQTQGNHLKVMMTLIGNYVFLANVNANTINGNLTMSNSDVVKNITKFTNADLAKTIWNKNGKKFKIDFNASGIGALSDYAEVLNNYYQTNIKAVTINTEGNFVPTLGIMSSINRYLDIVKSIKRDNRSVLKDNFLLSNFYAGENPLIKEIEARSGVRGKNGEVISPSRLNTKELLKTNILYEFLSNKINNNSFKIQPTNYADKNVHSLLSIDPDALVKYWDTKNNTWSTRVAYKNLSNDQVLDTYYKTMLDYYLNLGNELNNDYIQVAPFLSTTYLNNTKYLNDYVNEFGIDLTNLSSESFPEDVIDQDLLNEIEGYNYLSNLSLKRTKNQDDLIKSLNKVNKAFSYLNDKAITSAFKDANATWVSSIHFEKVGNKFGINRSLIHLIQEFSSNKVSNIKNTEKQFLQSLIEEKFTIDKLDNELKNDKLIQKADQRYNTLKKFYNSDLGTYNLYNGDINGNFELNPILKDYLWNHLLVARNFQLLTVGSPLGHPAKLGPNATQEQLLAARLVAQNKRMVIHQATMHPYSMNLINGIGFKTNKLFLADPAATVFNITGQSDEIDAVDGGTYQLLSTTNMQNNSLLDQKVGYTHKSISGTISERLGVAGLTKHAAFSITNENIRNSPILRQIANKLLDRRFNRVGDIDLVNIDVSLDYNNEYIDIEGLIGEVAFIKTNEHFQFTGLDARVDNGRLVKFKGLQKGDNNQYIVTYQVGLIGDTIDIPVSIETLADLWNILGGSQSMTKIDSEIGNKPDSELDGYIHSNSSWDALTEYINRVGFWYNNEDIGRHLVDASPKNIKTLKENFNTYVHEPNSLNVSKNSNSHRATQKNVIQPLKLNHLGEITFNSGQKVGMKNGMNLNQLMNAESEADITTSLESNLHNGIQLNADHEADQSEVTEQTQIINTLSFTGDTQEFSEKAFRAISKYINQKLGDVIRSVNDNSSSSDANIYKLIKRIVIKAFEDKEVDTLANSIVQNIKREFETGVASNMDLPISSSELYNTINTAISNFFTKEGIRRKMAGMAAVAKPYSQFIKFKRLPDGTTVSVESFEKWRRNNAEYPETSIIRNHDFDVNDTVIDPQGNRIPIIDASTYIRTKLRMDREGGSWQRDNFADRELGSTYHKFKVNGVGSFTYYDLPIVALPNFLNDVNRAYKNYTAFLGDSVEISTRRKTQEGTNEEKQIANKALLDLRISEYNEVLNLANLQNPRLQLQPLVLDGDNKINYSTLTEQEENRLRNLINQTLIDAHNTNMIPLPFTAMTQMESLDIIDGKIRVDEIETVLGEVAMSFPHKSTFGIETDVDISDINVEYFQNQLNRFSLPATTMHDMYLKQSNGNHLYIVFEGSDNHQELITSGVLEPVKLDTVERNGIIYELDDYGNEKYQTGFDTIYRGNVDGKVLDYIILEKGEESKLGVMFQPKGSKYDTLIFNYQSGIMNLSKAIKLADLGLIYNKNDYLLRLYQLLKSNSDLTEELPEFTELITFESYDEDWADQQIAITQSKLSELDPQVDSNKINTLTRKLNLLNNYKIYDENISENRDTVLEILAVDRDPWVRRQINYITKVGKSEENAVQDALEALQVQEMARLETLNERIAIAKHASFKEALNITAARIPGQDFQSYSAMKVVNFINNESNIIFVPPKFQWTTGGDFDIDKVFTTYYSIGRDGLISGWTTLWDNRNEEFLKQSLRLPLPEPNEYTTILQNQINGLSNDEVVSIVNYIREGNYTNIQDFTNIVNATRKINSAKEIQTQTSGLTEDIIQDLISFASWYSNESDNVYDKNGAALNAIFSGVKDSISDIRNIVNSYLPVTFGKYKDKASKSSKGEQMAKMSYENPVDIFRAQVANMVGKEVIGIAASSGLKAYSVLAQAFTKVRETGTGPNMKSYRLPVYENGKFSFRESGGIYGVNFNSSEDMLRTYLRNSLGLPTGEINTIINNLLNSGNISLDLSAILSAATDNAKELILSRINAGPDTAGFYLAAAMLGVNVDTISEIMISSTTDAVLNLANRDIYTGREISFNSALEQIRNGILDSENYFDFKIAGNIVKLIRNKEINGVSLQKIVDEQYKKDIRSKDSSNKKDIIVPQFVRTNPFTFLNLLAKALTPEQYNVVSEHLKSARITNLSNLDGFSTRNVRQIRRSNDDLLNDLNNELFTDDILSEFQPIDDIEAAFRQDDEMGDLVDFSSQYPDIPTDNFKPDPTFQLNVLFNRYLQDYSTFITEPNIDVDILTSLDVLGKFKSDIELLAKLTSVNQKVRNSHYDLRKFSKALDTYIRSNFFSADQLRGSTALTDFEINNIVDNLKKSVLAGTYIPSSNFKTSAGNSIIDVLYVIQESPHMRAMLEAAMSAYDLYRKVSVKTRTIDGILNTIGSKLETQQNYVKVSSFVDDAIISHILSNMDPNFINFYAKVGDIVDINGKPLESNYLITLNSVEGRMKFVNWFENTVIRDLKDGISVEYDDYTGEPEMVVDSSIASNEFIKRLTMDMRTDVNTGIPFTYFKIPIDMLDTTSDTNSEMIDTLKVYFSTLKNKTYAGRNLIDYFFLYNLIVNKGKVSSNSITPLLDSVTDLNSNNIVATYIRTLGDMDKSDLVLDSYNMNDLAARNIGVVLHQLPTLGTDTSKNEQVVTIRSWDENDLTLKNTSYYLFKDRDWYYKKAVPQTSAKYVNVDMKNVNSSRMLKVAESIKLDMLNKLISNINRIITNC